MSTKIRHPATTVKMLPIKTSSVGISSPVDCADGREAMPVNWARCLEWSSSFSHSYANRTLLYTQAQCVFQTSHAETRNAAPNARKYYDITLVQNSFWHPPFWTGEAAQEPDAGGLKLRR